MTDVRVEGNNYIGPAGGPRDMPVFCPDHGLTWGTTGFKLQNVTAKLRDNYGSCCICGKRSKVIEGDFQFTQLIFSKLINATVTRQQIRQFERIINKTTDHTELTKRTEHTNPVLSELTLYAIREPNTDHALKLIIQVAKCIVATGLTLSALAGGIIAADEISDRVQRNELFENQNYPSNPIKDQLREKTQPENNNEKSPARRWGPDEVT